jgi:hypothetical protein
MPDFGSDTIFKIPQRFKQLPIRPGREGKKRIEKHLRDGEFRFHILEKNYTHSILPRTHTDLLDYSLGDSPKLYMSAEQDVRGRVDLLPILYKMNRLISALGCLKLTRRPTLYPVAFR